MTDQELRDAVRGAVHEEMRASRSIRKNGETVPAWFFGKVLTLDRMIWVGLLLYALGGKAVMISEDTKDAITTAAAATKATEELSDKVDELSVYVMDQAANRSAENEQTRATVAAMNQRVTATVTRGELRTLVNQEILPRLQRIETEQKRVASELSK